MATTYGFLSTHPPTRCGLATFNAALAGALTGGAGDSGIVRVTTGGDEGPPGPGVTHTWPARDPSGWRDAADVLNGYDVAIIQHEYGIYPGADGADVLRMMRRLRVPSIVVLHTVLSRPTPRQKSVLEQVVGAAGRVVTMTRTAHDRLIVGYDVDPAKVSAIPHGAADHTGTPAVRGPRPHLLTWGLLGPGKGIEWAIRALPHLRRLDPVYTVAGRTHPKVLDRQGETYRTDLHKLGAELVQARPVRLAVPLEHLGMGPPGDGVDRIEAAQVRQRPDGPLDALAGPEQTPGEQVRPGPADHRRAGVVGRAVRDGRHLGRIHVVADDQPVVRGVGHGDDRARGPDDLLQHRLLPGCGTAQHGVQDDDARHPQPAHQPQHVRAVGAGVDAVLVLDDRDVVAVEGVGGSPPAVGVVPRPGVRHVGARRSVAGAGGHPDHAAGGGTGGEGGGQGRVEGGQTAAGRRVGAEEAVSGGHRACLPVRGDAPGRARQRRRKAGSGR